MKTIARQFTARTGAGEAKRQKTTPQLRLLPTPLHRYPSTKEDDAQVIDGSVFCFVVEGGNPQIIFLLEAVKDEEGSHWRCGFSRRTFAQLKVFHKDNLIWAVPFFPGRQMRSTGTFHRISIPNQDE